MTVIVLYLGTRFDVYECKRLRDMTIGSFFCDIWPSPVTFIVWLSLDGCYVVVYWFQVRRSIEFEIRTIVWRKFKWRHNDVIICLILWNSNKNLSHLSITHRHIYMHIQTNCNENITPARFRGGVKRKYIPHDFVDVWKMKNAL